MKRKINNRNQFEETKKILLQRNENCDSNNQYKKAKNVNSILKETIENFFVVLMLNHFFNTILIISEIIFIKILINALMKKKENPDSNFIHSSLQYLLLIAINCFIDFEKYGYYFNAHQLIISISFINHVINKKTNKIGDGNQGLMIINHLYKYKNVIL